MSGQRSFDEVVKLIGWRDTTSISTSLREIIEDATDDPRFCLGSGRRVILRLREAPINRPSGRGGHWLDEGARSKNGSREGAPFSLLEARLSRGSR
ncbi:hypothetical protein KM043_016843 [Ampulex compressa]|nr:hypothetical protein KM043_016843 [Ampulex compressa]